MENLPHGRVLSPIEAGDVHGDYYYEFDGVRSTTSYASRANAKKALDRRIEKWLKENS